MLNVYGADWCAHTRATVKWLKEHQIPFNYINIEKQSEKVVQKIVEVNGGKDWCIPTLKYNNQWRAGQDFNAVLLERDLKKLGALK